MLSEPIAVVGVSCRFPGASGPAEFWRLLRAGVDALTGIPEHRGGRAGMRGGVLDRVDEFDPAFFGISAREAAAMDPQQRLMLELGWEALEDARLIPGRLAQTRTGVFIGAIADDYATLMHRHGIDAVTQHTMTGTNRGLIANRLSYVLGLRGPSMSIDAAQASALVSVHLAVQSLHRGESTLALAGGVQLNLAPDSAVRADRFGGLSPDGRCFVFDARANGFVRGEGGGLVVLKRLADAHADGDRVYCVIRGSAINNDGGGPNLTAPNVVAQQELLRQAYQQAGLDPAVVDYVELHGTGTRIGDPVEAAALGAVIGAARPTGSPLAVGSVKTNIGHLEGAAGIAGLLKTVLSIHHGVLAPSLNFETPNPDIPLDALNLHVQQAAAEWTSGRPRVAGVSSFGVGGTNCHVVLAEYVAAGEGTATGRYAPRGDGSAAGEVAAGEKGVVAAESRTVAAGALPWVLSGRDEESLRAQARSLRAYLRADPGFESADIGYSLATTRTALEHRAVLLGDDPQALLDSLAEGMPAPDLLRGTVVGDGSAVFVFPGQGSQWAGMALELLESSAVFAARIRECGEALAPHADWSLTEVLGDAAALERVDVVQPALWAVMVSLAELWQSYGVRPSAVVGHSQGEIAAACVAGALSLEDAARVVAVRGRLLAAVSGGGGMASVALPVDRIELVDGLSIAAINGPNAVVVSGASGALDELVSSYQAAGVRARRIAVDYAAHSAEVEPLRARLLAELADIRPLRPGIPMLSTVTGEWIDDAGLDPEYWYRNLREPVQLESAVRILAAAGPRVFVEASPHPVLSTGIQETAGDAVVVESLRRGDGGQRRFLTSVGQAWAHGVAVRPEAVFAGTGARRVDLPTYAFQRRRYWFDDVEESLAAQPARAVRREPGGELDLVRAHAAAVLGQASPDAIDTGLPFRDLGIDSHLAVELRNRLSTQTGLPLPATLLFDYPTCTAVADFLTAELSGARAEFVPAEAQSATAHDPIAIVAMSCRLPGGIDSPEDLWRLLAAGGDAIGDFPADRGWDPHPDTAFPRIGGFLYDAGDFDPSFFGISPREALAMDPQQRLLLETSWEAFERAGIDPAALRGTRTGVFIGAMAQDYGPRLHEAAADGFLLTGNLAAVASGRLAYTYGLEGPALTVDTACSSSLLALHLASQALRQGECSLALAGGVTVMANPGMFVEFARQGGLSPDGRCKAFAAEADGTGWSEGAGLLVLERLSDARRNNHRVLAVLRGSAVNQDGASNGLTAPNGPSQQRVIRQALANAGLVAADVDAVEAHGTGTVLGDPIEAQALLATYGQDRDRPLWLGSLKSNIGHTQAAAGVAGVIKMVLALQHQKLPKTLHADQPSPHVDWSTGAVELLTEPAPWPETTRPRRAGISSFGISGTNAHVILEQAPPIADPPAAPVPPVVPWVLSAKTPAALRAQAQRLRTFADTARQPDLPTADTARQPDLPTADTAPQPDLPAVDGAAEAQPSVDLTAAAGPILDSPAVDAPVGVGPAVGSAGGVGSAVGSAGVVGSAVGSAGGVGSAVGSAGVVGSAVDLAAVPGPAVDLPVADLAAVGRSLAARSVLDSRAVVLGANREELLSGLTALAEGATAPGVLGGGGKVAFVFPGQGSQWPGMALELAESAPIFAQRLAECGDALAPFVDWSLPDVLGDAAALARVDVVQPALWAVMVSLAELWRSHGVEPAAVVGHSQGEIAAAVVAGGLSLEDGARVVALRSRALLAVSGRGGMVSVARSAEALGPLGAGLSLAAVNGPGSVVISGDPGALAELLTRCEAEGVRARRIPVDYASHSAHVEAIQAELSELMAPVRPKSGAIPFYSAVTGKLLDTVELSAEYWYRNLRETVRFEQATRALIADGHRVFVETSAHPVLTAAIQETAEEAVVVGSLRREEGDLRRFLTSLGEAFCGGVPVDWAALFPGARQIDLPTYPFERQRYWLRQASVAEPVADAWRYRIDWQPLPEAESRWPGTWLVVAPPDETEFTSALARRGAQVLRIAPGAGVAGELAGIGSVGGAGVTGELAGIGSVGGAGVAGELAGIGSVDGADVARQLAGIGPVDGVLSLLALDEQPHPLYPAVPQGFAQTLALVQALGAAGIEAPLWSATRGAVSVSGEAPQPDQALVWGLGRVAALELPDRWGGLVDLPRHGDPAVVDRLIGVLSGTEDQVAVRADGAFGRRLARVAPGRKGSDGWAPSGTVLVTGGTGALGAHTARWLAASGAEHLVLVSRRGPAAAGAAELEAELRALGAEITVAACDVADRAALAELISGLPALDAVVHTAAVLDDSVVEAMTIDQVDRVLRVKARAAWNLHELTLDRNLSAFVLFSSLAGVVGTPGQGNYAPGNAYLDALAEFRRTLGLPATAIAWGPWAGDGMGQGEFGTVARRHGVPMMRPAAAVRTLEEALEAGESGLLVADIEWSRFAVAFTATRPSPLLASLLPAAPVAAAAEPGARSMLHVVRQQVATVLGYPDAEAVSPAKAFKDLGFDSVTSVDLRNRLIGATGRRLPAAVVYDYPSPQALAEFLGGAGESTDRPAAAAAPDEPIAIIGMACRFPGGVNSPEDLWELVLAERETVSGFPADRGWDTAGLFDSDRLSTRAGSFLDDAPAFDAGFFGITPREALAMDPQQRLLLETSWEAFEHAGLDPEALRGNQIGVFAGTNGQDYSAVLRADGGGEFEGYLATGTSAAVLSGRVSYAFGFEGPAVTVDTACSSALVALHLAAESLRKGECALALAGGVTVMSTPDLFVEFSRQGGLSPDGRCRAFAGGANGTAWGEGAGMLLVERLSDARRNGHPVLAVVRGSAVNQDGASNGLAAPNGPAQQRVIRQALADAGVTAAEVDVVEGHGTGTTLGDPIEAEALLATYGQDRERPLWLGSIKSNIGHTQAAAGVAGVIKMVQAMRHGVLPPTLHAGEPTPHVDWSAGAVALLAETRDWPELDRPRRAGVSSFGISGTNAHVVLEAEGEAASEVRPSAPSAFVPWVLSGKGESAVRAQAARLLASAPDAPPADVAFALAKTRAALADRAVVLGADQEELRAGLRALAAGDVSANVLRGSVAEGGLAFLFSGQGSQRLGMGRGLYEAYPSFAAAFDEVCAAMDLPLREVIWGADRDRLNQTEYAQAGLFALEVALFRLMEHWGIHPDYLLGHSIGELAAAHVSGVLSLHDAAALVTARGRLMQALPAGGVMVAVQAAAAELRLIEGVSIAAINGPNAVVLSGDADAVPQVVGARKAKQLKVSHAFHSARMEPMLDEFRAIAAGLSYRSPRIPIVSNLTGEVVEVFDAEYWVRHVRESVRFADGMACLAGSGVRTFVELGPDGTLTTMGRDCVPEAGFTPLLRKQRPEPEAAISAVAQLHTRGISPDWAALLPGARSVELPTYAFQRQRYWPVRAAATPDALRYGIDWWQLAEPDQPVATGNWVVVGPAEHELVASCAATLAAHGATVRVVTTIEDARGVDADGVLSLAALDETTAVAATLAILAAGIEAPLWCVTRGAVSTRDSDVLESPMQAQIWGLGRVAALEHPQRWGGLIDLPETLDVQAQARLIQVLSGAAGDDQVAVRPWGLFGRRLTRATRKTLAHKTWRPRGTILITGGTGALGAHVARWLARNGAGHLVLTARRGPSAPGAADLVAELTELGARATVVACDVADRAALAQVLADHPVDAVVHAAGISHIAPLSETTPADLAETTAGKVLGAAHLDELLGDRELDAFVLFSSISAVWGVGGLGAYAAGNAYLDAVAQQRRARGRTATSIAWGPWADGGMVEAQGEQDPLLRRGVPVIAPERAIAALQQALDHDDTVVAVAEVDWARFAPLFTLERPSPMLAGIPEARRATEPEPASGRAERVAAVSDEELLELVRRRVAEVAGHTGSAAIEPGRSFHDLGFDSLTAVELRDRLTADSGLTLPATLVFDYPTPLAVTEYLAAELRGGQAPAAALPATAADTDDPIVIVGMSCRFPGGIDSPEDLWQVVRDGVDALSEFPADRGWDLHALPAEPRAGGFLYTATEFDAAFFGISPREALTMDPQQRLLLESSWELFERAGIDPDTLRGTRTGVFIGAAASEYGPGLRGAADSAEGYALTGSVTAVASGRIAYTFGLEGPAVTLDTACSSSLVALHLACQSLRQGESSMALVGGVAVMAEPGAFIDFGRQGGLAADGRCKAFAATADGTGWAEGVGMLLVERLSDARHHGHQVLAVVRGSAINSDGASNGLTAPNGPAQQRVIRAALANAGLHTADVDAVEAHGTGTKLGDPIEAQALLATYGQDRDHPLWLGSVKSNIGHAQAAAGMSGIIKMVQALRHGILPRTLHLTEPTPHVDWSSGAISLLTDQIPWPETTHPRRAAVSAFGMSGTNAHVIVEASPDAPSVASNALAAVPDVPVAGPDIAGAGPEGATAPVPWVLSARSSVALGEQANRLRAFVERHPELEPADVGWSLAVSRAAHPYRMAVVGRDRAELLAGLGMPAGTEAVTAGKVAFLFAGQGSQRAGMGADLYANYPVFAAAFDAVCARFDRSVRDVLVGDGELLDQTMYTQAGLFALEVALFRLLEHWGVAPDFVLGHSIGELAAAHVAGVLSLDDACTLVAARGRLMQALPVGGAMVAIDATEAEVLPLLSERASIAAINGPRSVVVSGDEDAVDQVAGLFVDRRSKRLRVSHAFHSPRMDPMLAEFRRVAEQLTYSAPRIPLVSNLTGALVETFDAEYWVRHVREAVRFADGMRSLAELGVDTFAELGPDATLTAMGQESVPEAGFVPVLRKQRPEPDSVISAVAQLFTRGTVPDWTKIFPAARRVELPTYAFQRQRFWLEPQRAADPADARFWEAVEHADLDFFESALRLAPDRPLAAALPALSLWRRNRREQSAVDSWRYRVNWKALADNEFTPLPGTWAVVYPAGTARRPVVEALESHGATVVEIEMADADRDALAHRLPGTPLSGVVSLLALDERPDPEHPSVPRGYAMTLALVQALSASEAPLWCLTRGAVSVAGESAAPGQSLVWGLGPVLGSEHPERWGGLVDLPEHWDEQVQDRLAGALAGVEDQVAIRPDGVFGRRLARAPLGRTNSAGWTPSGTVLVTGGTGALGVHTARWLAGAGAEHVVLVSRRGPDAPGAAKLAAELRELGAVVTVVACDIADRAALARLLSTLPALDAVVHTAAVLEDGVIAALTVEQVDRVLRVKAQGAWHLHELTAELNLSAFVLFSSLAGVVGTPGQGNYAPGNAYLDALADYRRSRGLPATAITWGPWAGGGLAEHGAGETARRHGVPAMAPELAIAALRQALANDETAVAVADIDWSRFAVALTATRPRRLLADLPEAQQPDTIAESGAASLAERLAGANAAEQNRALVHLVRAQVATVLGHADPTAIESARPFSDLGFDSVTAVEFRNRLAAETGVRLPATLVFDFPTPQSLATGLRAELFPEPAHQAAAGIAEFDRLATVLAGISPSGAEHAMITARLEDLLAKWKNDDRPPDNGAVDEIASATAEELFDILHKEFGKSVGDVK
ncbi:type I polyketide synthase [Nocardia sp. NPDC051832]|uniref:type I polyketide synthase n=1 Tax=Nocardia sp. NPDC051832 TaxID=3155673 RepID=UPI0034233875